jgi:electron transfer flavoprotein alpha subunit
VAAELLGGAARLAQKIGGRVTAVGMEGAIAPEDGLGWGADDVVLLTGDGVAEDVADALATWCASVRPWAVLAPSTMWGREVASRTAARLGAGLTGDAVDLAVRGGRLVAWKPAFGGHLVAAITASSRIQMATVRPGMMPASRPRYVNLRPESVSRVSLVPRGRVRVLDSGRDDEVDDLALAHTVVGVGSGVDPEDYPQLRPLLDALGAELAASRKVTDRNWQPRARQIGITGRSLSPRLYVAIGVSGKFNHMVGVRGAGKVLAINLDPDAPVFASSDVGIVADWRTAVPMLVDAVRAYRAGEYEDSVRGRSEIH